MPGNSVESVRAFRLKVPRKRLAMCHISEVLRLAAQGHSQREISISVGISRTSVHNYLARARRAGLSWPLPEHLYTVTGGSHASVEPGDRASFS